MGAWAYCTNEDCQRGFDKPSFAEITARKRQCPACGQINHVVGDLGTALDEKFEEIEERFEELAELLTAGSQPIAAPDVVPLPTSELAKHIAFIDGKVRNYIPLHGSRPSVFTVDGCDVAAGTIVPPPEPFVPGEAPRKTASQVNAENLDNTIAALRDTFGTKTGRSSATSANASAKPQSVAAGQEANTAQVPFQRRVHDWMLECFGATIAADKAERNHRFLEEALELVQSTGCTATEAYQLVDYVYGRPAGDPVQEVGGVTVTLAALCTAHNIDTRCAEEAELTRIWTKVEQIRAKQATKPKHSPLPGRTVDPLPLLCTLRIAPHGVIADIKDLVRLPAGTYNVVLICKES